MDWDWANKIYTSIYKIYTLYGQTQQDKSFEVRLEE